MTTIAQVQADLAKTQADFSTAAAAHVAELNQIQADLASLVPPPPPPPPSGARYSVYHGNITPAAFQTLTGQPTTGVMGFGLGSNWSTIAQIGAQMAAKAKADVARFLICPVNICADSQPSHNQTQFADVANGQHDSAWNQIGKDLVAGGYPDAVIRGPWEFNGGWFPWAANDGTGKPQAAWIPANQRVVTVMRNVPGQKFTFMWNPTYGDLGVGDLAQYYPGDAYVDLVALDAYDTSSAPYPGPSANWQRILSGPFGLSWLHNFAGAHGKALCIPEWGLVTAGGTSPAGGGDNPLYITNMLAWIKANNVTSSYWNNWLQLQSAPNALAAFKAAFA